ncbi:MAG: hypothetical protein P1U34_10725 [Coxiellaceae bacterium]|nr:hypothetical protein [Coxiellaceae bacterium]
MLKYFDESTSTLFITEKPLTREEIDHITSKPETLILLSNSELPGKLRRTLGVSSVQQFVNVEDKVYVKGAYDLTHATNSDLRVIKREVDLRPEPESTLEPAEAPRCATP